jgi:hypothetical protein
MTSLNKHAQATDLLDGFESQRIGHVVPRPTVTLGFHTAVALGQTLS